MGFGGASSQTTSNNSPWAGPLAAMGKQAWGVAQPLLSTLGSQFLEALKTGGVNSFLPWINRAVDASRMASSKGIEGLRQNLARTGQTGSFGQQALSEAEMSAGDATANIPSQLIQSFISGAPGFALGAGGLGVKSTAAAGNLQNTSTTTSQPSFWDQFFQGLSSGGEFGMGGGFSGLSSAFGGLGSLFGGGAASGGLAAGGSAGFQALMSSLPALGGL